MPLQDVFVTGARRGDELYGVTIKEEFPNPDSFEEPGTWECGQSGGLILVSGIDAYVQGLRIMLRTRLGCRPMFPTAGTLINDLIGKSDKAASAEFLRAESIRSLMTDPRTAEVVKVIVDKLGDYWRITATVRPVNRPDPISFEHFVSEVGVR